MRTQVTESEVEQFARFNQARAKARGATMFTFPFYLSCAQTHFEMGGTMPPDAAAFAPTTPEASKAPLRPLPAPVATIPPRPLARPVPAAVVDDRARALALIAMTAKGAEAEAECSAAIRSGATVEEYAATVAARSILNAMGASGHGRR